MKRDLKGMLSSGRSNLISLGTAVLMIAAAANAAAVYQINCGGSAVSPYIADQYFSGGTANSVTNTITITGITNPAPIGVYQKERYGTCTYTIPGLTASTQYLVRLHFAELYHTTTGARKFNVVINGTTVLTNFDVYSVAGARYKAVLREFTVTSNSSGQIVINFNTVTNNATIGGIEVHTTTSAPTITTQPASQTINVNSPVTFTVVATGTPAPTYQWKKGGTDISGATGSSYTISSVQTTDAGFYTVVVTNTEGSVTSNAATLTVNCPVPVITGQPASVTKTEGETATFNVTATGTGLSYQWRKNAVNISGANSAAYTTPILLVTDNNAQYTVVVSNACGSVTSNSATLTVNYAAPVITQQPQPQSVTVGETATFTITAMAMSGTLTYQWRKNGTSISGTNSTTYTTPATTLADNGALYSCVVTNPPGNGSVSSNNTLLTVSAAPVPPTITAQPANQSVFVGATATFSVTVSGTAPLNYQWKKGGADISGATSSSYTTPATTLSDNGAEFTCVITNVMASVLSNTATLTVTIAPVVYAYPEDCGPGENMKVDGQIKCNSLLIHTWLLSQKGMPRTPDYVFDKTYKLPSLMEIEKYINSNGHLPEVPAAKELESNGVDMVQLNFILLKKIEEMTLHMIAQEKKMKEMEKKIAK